jgi:hypothetical protein
MRERFKALIVPNKAPFITDLNHMCDPVILPHKAATGFEGGAHHIALRCAFEALAQPFGEAPVLLLSGSAGCG